MEYQFSGSQSYTAKRGLATKFFLICPETQHKVADIKILFVVRQDIGADYTDFVKYHNRPGQQAVPTLFPNEPR
jgi:predicted Zn-dependent protease